MVLNPLQQQDVIFVFSKAAVTTFRALCLLALCGLSLKTLAAPLLIGPGPQNQAIGTRLDFFEDRSGQMAFDAVRTYAIRQSLGLAEATT